MVKLLNNFAAYICFLKLYQQYYFLVPMYTCMYCSIIESKKTLADNLKLSDKDERKVTKLLRLRISIFAVINVFYPFSSNLYFYQFFAYSKKYCQIISHYITYSVYKKEVKKKLRQYYQCFQRLFPLRPSKVITLHPQ